MADKQSREVTETTDYHWTVRRDAKKLGHTGDLTLKVNVDVSEALTGLKAVQREAREATKALRELETYYESEGKRFYVNWKQDADDGCTDIREICMSDIPTDYLRRELTKRAAGAMISLGDKVASKSISEDICRSYGLADAKDGDCE